MNKTDYTNNILHYPHLYDVLIKVNDKLYNGMFSEHVVDDEGWIDGYEIIGGGHNIFVFEFGDSIGYVNLETDGKFYLDIENCGYVKDTLQECYDILYNYYGGN